MTTLFQNKRLRVSLDEASGHTLVTPGTGRGAVVVPVTGDGFLMVTQYRPCIAGISLEFPRGGVEAHQTPVQAALAELAEETGAVVTEDQLTHLGVLHPDTGLSTTQAFVYAAPVRLDALDPTKMTPGETEVVHITDLDQRIALGQVCCGVTLGAYALYRSRVHERHDDGND